MNYQTCPVYDCCGGTIIRDNGMRARCRNCDGRGVVEAPHITASREPMAIHGARGTDIHEHAGPPIVTPAPGQHVIVLDGLTPDEVRVITGLVRAMRKHPIDRPERIDASIELRVAKAYIVDAQDDVEPPVMNDLATQDAASAAWHIAHAISQMGES